MHTENNSITGEIPSEVGNLTSLVELSIGDNALTGTIPTELGLIQSMVSLNMCELSRLLFIFYDLKMCDFVKSLLMLALQYIFTTQ